MKHILLTGGGTAGHVTPNLALLPELRSRGYSVEYIGSKNGIERDLITQAGVPYHAISSGKLRRYFSLQNFTDPFRVLAGFFQAKRILKQKKPDVIFSKGGFVAVPVVLAARKLDIPTVIHESDMTPGLANKLCIPSARKVCCNFPETMNYLPVEKAVLSGSPIRRELMAGDRLAGLNFTGLSSNKPVLLIIGGSMGSVKVNTAIRSILPQLLETFQVIHLCGKGHLDKHIHLSGYIQYEYIGAELKDLFALADIVVSRAGANAICELLALHKPSLLIPLPAAASRGDQILNANSFAKQGFSAVLEEERLSDQKLLETILEVYKNRSRYVAAMENSRQGDAIRTVCDLLDEVCEK